MSTEQSSRLVVDFASVRVRGVPVLDGQGIIPLSDTVEVFGDSLSDSRSPQNQETWATRLGNVLSKTIIGTGVSGNKTDQMLERIYDTRDINSEDSAAIFIGTNDLNSLNSVNGINTIIPNAVIEQITANVVSATLYCCLPGSSKFNARDSTKVGTWFNTPSFTNIGIGSSVNASSVSQEVTGRYVSFTVTSVNQVAAPGNSTLTGPIFDFTITNTILDIDGTVGTASNQTEPVFSGSMQTSPRIVGGFLVRTYIFDTGVEGTHDIEITLTNDAGGDIYVDWFAGWSSTVQDANTTIVIGVPQFQYLRHDNTSPGTVFADDIKRETYNLQLKLNCDMLRKRFSLPVYYVEPGATPSGHTSSDGLHLTFGGQRFLGDTVISAVQGNPYY